MTSTTQPAPETTSAEQQSPAEPTTDSLDFEKLRTEAAQLRETNEYAGELTHSLLAALEPLLNTRIPEEYLLHSPPTEGKPYHSTGLKSIQVQVDIANAVLGAAHWRLLTHYKTDYHVCHAWVIVGNDLQHAKLAEDGEQVEPGDADLFLIRDGWGGVKRSNHEGDGRKGAQTNAAKRALAQAGPGSSVYRLDFDDELVEGTAPADKPERAKRAQSRSADTGKRGSRKQTAAETTPGQRLAGLLALDDPLKTLRVEANKGMELLDFDVEKRLGWLQTSGGTEEELRGLIERCSTALEARDAQAETASA